MNAWLLSCNRRKFDLDRFRLDGQKLTSWSVHRFRGELGVGDRFVLWLSGADGGLVARGHLTGSPSRDASNDASYWREAPGVRWYVPLEVDCWLGAPIPRQSFLDDPAVAGASIVTQPFAGNPHRLSEEQWNVVRRLFQEAAETSGAQGQIQALGVAPSGGSAGVPVGGAYRTVGESTPPVIARRGVPDPDLVGRNFAVHSRLQNVLARAVVERGLEALSPGPADPEFDLAWRARDGELTVCEVKSLTSANESSQLRLGLGQVLDYQDQLLERAKTVRAVLWVEREPAELRWLGICRRAGVELAWPGGEDRVRDLAC
ncbi:MULTISPECIES: hypothetical protein [unclassified Streptomyces]|uniref:hypothetical protein n=1 Tax=unclassified Streptomyces TaxID=2593676 RepID=UPI0033E0FEF1